MLAWIGIEESGDTELASTQPYPASTQPVLRLRGGSGEASDQGSDPSGDPESMEIDDLTTGNEVSNQFYIIISRQKIDEVPCPVN